MLDLIDVMENEHAYQDFLDAQADRFQDAELSNPERAGFDAYRPMADILADLAKPVPGRLLKTKRIAGTTLTYIPWYRAQKILEYYAPGWRGEVTKIVTGPDRIYVTYRIGIPTREGWMHRESTGTERLDTDSFGDPSSNAESMAFRRACARFGLGLDLYEKDAQFTAAATGVTHVRPRSLDRSEPAVAPLQEAA